MNVLERFGGASMTAQELDRIPRLGHLIFYNIGEICIPYKQAERLVENAGFPRDMIARSSKKKAYLMAMDDIRNMSPSAKVRTFARPIMQTDGAMYHQITLETVNRDNVDLSYEKQMKTTFDKKTGKITFEASFASPALTQILEEKRQEILSSYAKYRRNATKFIFFDFMKNCLDRWNTTIVKPQGGVWFVPEYYTTHVKAVDEMFSHINSKLFYSPIVDTKEWRENISQMADQNFEGELANLQKELEELLDKTKEEGGKIRIKVLETRLDRYEDLRKRAHAYETLLNYQAIDIREGLNKLSATVENVLCGKVKELEPVKTKPVAA